MEKAIIYSESNHAASIFCEILKEMGFDDILSKVQIAFSGVDAAVSLQLINAGSNFEAAMKLAQKLSSAGSAAVMLLADAEACRQRGAQLRNEGVIVVEKPLSRQLFVQAIQDALSLQRRIRRMSEQMKEAHTIARAKLLLIEKKHMTEPQAHRHIEKEAMNRRITRLELARELIDAYK